jgi:class 3 adenylate cyclase
MTDLETGKQRKRGAPKGNWNGLRHGFYSKRLQTLDMGGAYSIHRELEDELALLRALLQEFTAKAVATGDLGWLEKALEMAGRTVVRLATVMRIHGALRDKAAGDEVFDAVREVMKIFPVFDADPTPQGEVDYLAN